MDDPVFSHVMNRFLQAEIKSSPFVHFHIENIFPEHFYQKLLEHLPETTCFLSLSKTGKVDPRTYADRLVIPLEFKNLESLPFSQFVFWTEFTALLKSERWCSFLLEAFALKVQERFAEHFARVRFSSTAELVRDRTHYSIGPHTDHPIRVLTLLFYLPRAEDQRHLGTSIYEPLDPAFECEGFVHHSDKGFKKLYTAPFLPNSVFGFIKSNRSFHGREPILDTGTERNLINYYLQWNHK